MDKNKILQIKLNINRKVELRNIFIKYPKNKIIKNYIYLNEFKILTK